MFGIDLGSLVVYLEANATQYERSLKIAQQQLQHTSMRMKSIGRSMSMYVTAPLTLIGGASVKAFASFDQAMTESLAIMKPVSDEMRQKMSETARTISTESITSASELAQSYYYLASAGLTAEQSVAALGTVNDFAVAGMFDMNQATTLLADAQAALGLKTADAAQNMLNMTRVSDVLVKANTLANASVEQFSSALTNKAAAAIKLLNKDVEEGVAVLAAFADQGIKGQRAGEALNMVSRDLQNAAIKNASVWKRMGMEVYDSQGNMRSYADIIEDLTLKFDGMSDAQKKQAAIQLGFQARSFSYLQMLIGTSDKIREYNEELDAAGSTTKRVSENQLKSFTAQMKILRNQVVNAAIGIGEILAPSVLKVNEYIQKAVGWWNKLSDGVKGAVVKIGLVAAAIGPALMVLGTMVGLISSAVGGLATLVGASVIIAKIGLIVAAVGGLVYILVGKEGLVGAWEKAKAEFVKFHQYAVGFVSNFSENIGILVDWLKGVWKDVFTDLANLWTLAHINMIDNLGVVIKTAVLLFAYFQGHISDVIHDLFRVDWVNTIYDAMIRSLDVITKWADKALKAIKSWGKSAWEHIKGIFTGEKVADFGGFVKEFEKEMAGAFAEGKAGEDFLGGAEKILEEGAAQLKSPFEGFESAVKKGLPKFKLEVETPAEEIQKAIDDAKEQAKLPKAVEERMGAAERVLSPASFQQIALNRMSLAGLAVTPSARDRQQVEAPGVNSRLDTLIELQTEGNQQQAADAVLAY